MLKCPFCDCEVFTKNTKAEGKKKNQPNLCVGCKYGTNKHKKMAKPKPHKLREKGK